MVDMVYKECSGAGLHGSFLLTSSRLPPALVPFSV